MTKRYYVGVTLEKSEVFRSEHTPLESTHGHLYTYAIGPFRTKRGAEFMRDYGKDNPHCQCVAQAERLASKERVQC